MYPFLIFQIPVKKHIIFPFNKLAVIAFLPNKRLIRLINAAFYWYIISYKKRNSIHLQP